MEQAFKKLEKGPQLPWNLPVRKIITCASEVLANCLDESWTCHLRLRLIFYKQYKMTAHAPLVGLVKILFFKDRYAYSYHQDT